MDALGMTPEDFGLKVRHSPAAIRVTAANKMRTATVISVAQDYSNRHVQGYAVPVDAAVNRLNLTKVQRVLANLGGPVEIEEHYKGGTGLLWSEVDGREVLGLVKEFRFAETGHPDLSPIEGNTSLLLDFLEDRISSEWSEWDVVVPVSKRGDVEEIYPGRSAVVRTRHAGHVDGEVYRITSKNSVAVPGDQAFALPASTVMGLEESGNTGDADFCRVRKRPLLLVHIVDAKPRPGALDGSRFQQGLLATLGFCLPGSRTRCVERQYHVNTVYRRQMESMFASESDDDEDVLEG
jgi:hypothetical protein